YITCKVAKLIKDRNYISIAQNDKKLPPDIPRDNDNNSQIKETFEAQEDTRADPMGKMGEVDTEIIKHQACMT
ncbi:hypothetical protein H2203_009276, partial [Taxawa tesnikishii (nom. ined.)]